MRPTVKLGEIGTFIRGVSYKKGDLLPKRENGCVSLLRSNNIQTELDLSELQYLNKSAVKDEQITKEGDILFCMSNGSPHLVGKNILLPELENYSFGAFCSIFRKTSESVLSEYIAKYLQSENYTSFITSLSRGAGINNLRGSDLESIEIPLPPLETQKAIVAKLDQIFAELDQTKSEIQKNLDNTDELWKSAYDRILSIKGDEKSLEDLCEIVDYRGKTPKKTDKGILLVTAKNIRKGYIDYEKSKEYISEDDYDEVMHRGLPKIGDILFTTEAPCGNVAIIDNENIALAQRVVKYRPKNKEYLNNKYLLYVLLGNEFQKKLEMHSTGGTVKGIKGKILHKLTIPVPPLSEQEKIVEHLDQVSKEVKELKYQYQSQLDNLEELKKSVLDKAFRGE